MQNEHNYIEPGGNLDKLANIIYGVPKDDDSCFYCSKPYISDLAVAAYNWHQAETAKALERFAGKAETTLELHAYFSDNPAIERKFAREMEKRMKEFKQILKEELEAMHSKPSTKKEEL